MVEPAGIQRAPAQGARSPRRILLGVLLLAVAALLLWLKYWFIREYSEAGAGAAVLLFGIFAVAVLALRRALRVTGRPAVLAVAVAGMLLAGHLYFTPWSYERERFSELIPVPPGGENLGSRHQVTSPGGPGAFGKTTYRYPAGTDTIALTHAVVETLRADGWSIEEPVLLPPREPASDSPWSASGDAPYPGTFIAAKGHGVRILISMGWERPQGEPATANSPVVLDVVV